MNYYELQYFYSRKENGSFYAKTELNKEMFTDDDSFLDALVAEEIITYHDAQQITEIVEITEDEYESFSY